MAQYLRLDSWLFWSWDDAVERVEGGISVAAATSTTVEASGRQGVGGEGEVEGWGKRAEGGYEGREEGEEEEEGVASCVDFSPGDRVE